MTEVRQEHDQLHYELEKNRKKLMDLSFQIARTEALNGEKTQETDVETLQMDLNSIEQEVVTHELTNEQLKHMHLAYKADILIQQKQMQNIKDEIRLGKANKERLYNEFENLSKQCDRYWNQIVV